MKVCRACCAAGLDAVFASMTSRVVDAPPHARAPGRLRIATCGDERKYQVPGQYRWTDYAVAALRQPGAELMHIGAVSDPLKAEIRGALAGAGLDPARDAFVGEKESLPATLIEAGTDLFLSSYPDGGGKLTLRIFDSLKPVIAAVNGPAVGIGVTMQLAMDIRIASEAARFGFVFARRGMAPEAASSWFLPRIVGISRALEWCYSGRVFSAAEALEGGSSTTSCANRDTIPGSSASA